MKNNGQENQQGMKEEEEQENLECIVSRYSEGAKYSNKEKEPVNTFLRKYLLDVTASWMFYTPLMAEAEYFIVGLEPLQIFYSRTFASAIGAMTMRPYGMFRDWWKKKWHVTTASSRLKKFAVDTSAMLIFQIPTYSSILYAAGVAPKQIALALPPAALIGMLSGRAYGFFLDSWRSFWNRPVQQTTDQYSQVFINHHYYQWKNGERVLE